MTKPRGALVALLLISLMPPLEAATYYVRKDGRDTNSGMSDNAQGAWLTISKAATHVEPGDIVYVRQGSYPEYVTLTRSGTPTAPISWHGERDAHGNHLTVVDPSIRLIGGWSEAPEIGANVYKQAFTAFTPAHLSADDHVVVRFKIHGNSHLELAKASNAVVENPQWAMPQPFWDGIEAGWTYTNNHVYIRFRDDSNAAAHEIKVSDNEDGVRFGVNKAACLVKTSHNTINGFLFKGTQFPVALVGDATHNQIVGNIVESNKVQQGFGQIILSGSRSSQCNVSENEIRHNFLQHKGYWETAGTTGGAVKYGDNESWPDYQYYWVTKNRWYDYPGSGFEHAGIVLCDVRDNNLIHGNEFSNGVHAIRYSSQQMWAKDIIATGTTISSNRAQNLSGAFIIMSYGHDLLYIHDNHIENAWMGIARFQSINRNRVGQNRIYIYRNTVWNPPGKGGLGYFHLHNETDTFQSEIWFYHNSYEGGSGGMTVSSWTSSVPDALGKVAFLNNIFSTPGEPVSSKYLTSPSSLRAYEYNRSQTIPTKPWVGEHNLALKNDEWGGVSPSRVSTGWELQENSQSISAGLDISSSFTLQGRSYAALPGFESDYYDLPAPNLGAVQNHREPPEEPASSFILSLKATDALLVGDEMSLEIPSVHSMPGLQTESPAYLYSPHSDRGSAHFHPKIPQTGSYTIWCQVMSRSADSDSFYVSINGEPERIFETKAWAPVWQWTRLATVTPSQLKNVNYAHQLRSGTNELSFRGRDPHTLLCRLLITNDPNLIPAEVLAARVAVGIRRTSYGQVLRWSSVAGTSYIVLYTPDFTTNPWTVEADSIIANGPETEWLAPRTHDTNAFYWVHTEM